MSAPLSAPFPADIRLHSWLAGILALLLFTIGNFQQSAIGFDTRFVLFAAEMLRDGMQFFPTTYGEPYPDYLATSTLFIYLCSLPFGRVSSFTATLPTALACAATVMLMYRLLAPRSRQWAVVSIGLLLLTATFLSEARAVSLDQMVSAIALAVFYLGYAADHYAAPRRMFWIFLLLALGMAVRGPIGLVIPTGILCSYYLLNGQWRRLFTFGFGAAALLVAGVGLLLALAYHTDGAPFVQDVIRMQVIGRIDGSEGASGPLYYFASSMGNYALAYPLAIVVLIAALITQRHQPSPALRLVTYCAVAGLVVMVGLSIPQAKKARYILPMLPMAAIIAAYPFAAEGRLFGLLRTVLQGLWLIIPGALMVGLLLAKHRLPHDVGYLNTLLGVLAVLQLAALALLFNNKWLKPQWRPQALAGLAVLAVWCANGLILEPVQHTLYDTRSFSTAVYRAVQQAPAPVVLHDMGKDAKAIKFMVNIDADLQPVFTDSPAQLAALKGPAWIVIDQADYQKLGIPSLTGITPTLSGQFEKDHYLLLHIAP